MFFGFMDLREKKAGSMDPVTMAKKTPRPGDVRAWALFTAACVTAFSVAVGYSIAHAHALDQFHVPCWQFNFLPCDHLTDAEEVAVNAIWLVILSCVALLAAVALFLPCRRRWVRRALACLALALTIVGHCLFATAACLFLVAHPGDLFLWICGILGIFLYAVVGPFSFLDFLLGGDKE